MEDKKGISPSPPRRLISPRTWAGARATGARRWWCRRGGGSRGPSTSPATSPSSSTAAPDKCLNGSPTTRPCGRRWLPSLPHPTSGDGQIQADSRRCQGSSACRCKHQDNQHRTLLLAVPWSGAETFGWHKEPCLLLVDALGWASIPQEHFVHRHKSLLSTPELQGWTCTGK